MSEPTTPPAGTSAETDNATIKAMRAQIDAQALAAKEATDRAASLETQLKEIERKDMDERTRLTAELADAKKIAEDVAKLRDENGRFTSEFEGLYNSRLGAVPEDKRPLVQQLSTAGSWPERVKAIEAAIGLLGMTAPPPTSAGTVTQPGGGAAPPVTPPETPRTEAPKPLTPDELKRVDLRGILDARRDNDPLYEAWGKKPKT